VGGYGGLPFLIFPLLPLFVLPFVPSPSLRPRVPLSPPLLRCLLLFRSFVLSPFPSLRSPSLSFPPLHHSWDPSSFPPTSPHSLVCSTDTLSLASPRSLPRDGLSLSSPRVYRHMYRHSLIPVLTATGSTTLASTTIHIPVLIFTHWTHSHNTPARQHTSTRSHVARTLSSVRHSECTSYHATKTVGTVVSFHNRNL